MIAAAQGEQPHLGIACGCDQLAYSLDRLLHGALADRAIDHACLAEPTSPAASPLYLHHPAIVNNPHGGNDRFRRWGHEPGHDPLAHAYPTMGHPPRHLSGQGFEGRKGTIIIVDGVVQARNIDAGNASQMKEQVSSRLHRSRPGTGPVAAHALKQLNQHLLSLADHKEIEKARHWLRIVGAASASDDQRHLGPSFAGQHRDTAQVQHVEHIAEVELVLQAETDHIEFPQRMSGLQGEEGDTSDSHGLFHVNPGSVDPLRNEVLMLVDQLVQDHQAQVRHPNLVGIGKGQGQPDSRAIPVLDDAIPFLPRIASRLRHASQQALQRRHRYLHADLPRNGQVSIARFNPATKRTPWPHNRRCWPGDLADGAAAAQTPDASPT